MAARTGPPLLSPTVVRIVCKREVKLQAFEHEAAHPSRAFRRAESSSYRNTAAFSIWFTSQ